MLYKHLRLTTSSSTHFTHRLTTSNTLKNTLRMSTSAGPWAQPPPPKTKLGLYRQLAPNAGLHVSPLQVGAMSIGDKWGKIGMGEMDKESSFKLLDAYYDAGGNFIDTANN